MKRSLPAFVYKKGKRSYLYFCRWGKTQRMHSIPGTAEFAAEYALLMRGTICQITEMELEELRDELARLRAEVERLKADGQRIMNEAVKMLNEGASDYNSKTNAMIGRHAQQMEELRAALSDERAHADVMEAALAEAASELRDYSPDHPSVRQIYSALDAHRARRQG